MVRSSNLRGVRIHGVAAIIRKLSCAGFLLGNWLQYCPTSRLWRPGCHFRIEHDWDLVWCDYLRVDRGAQCIWLDIIRSLCIECPKSGHHGHRWVRITTIIPCGLLESHFLIPFEPDTLVKALPRLSRPTFSTSKHDGRASVRAVWLFQPTPERSRLLGLAQPRPWAHGLLIPAYPFPHSVKSKPFYPAAWRRLPIQLLLSAQVLQ